MTETLFSQLAPILTLRQAQWTAAWHDAPGAPEAEESGVVELARENHRRNFDLWHQEDEARRDDRGTEYVYRAKRAIDRLNQERNDFIQRIDESLIHALQPAVAGCPLHSETPGMIIDRLSILALKLYHMEQEAGRPEAAEAHRENARGKAVVLARQRDDLRDCLHQLLADIAERRRTFKVYFQFKMYNDPNWNPALYRQPPPEP